MVHSNESVPPQRLLGHARRIVVKIGSALLAEGGPRLTGVLAKQLAHLQGEGREIVVVSSGAIALGLRALGLTRRPHRLDRLQAAAAIGQPELVLRWRRALARHKIAVAQVLITHSDVHDRERFINIRHAMLDLLRHNVMPIVNENDSVATEEIRVGDNDRLAGAVANLIDADLVVLLTTVQGLYDADPHNNRAAKRLSLVEDIKSVSQFAGGAGPSGLGTGGMRTKIEAAQAAAIRGIPLVIAHGRTAQVLLRIVKGDDIGTFFVPKKQTHGRRHWIGFALNTKGTLIIDQGAADAICLHGKSLLPSGLRAVQGVFSRGAMIEVVGPAGPVARGLAAYSDDEMRRLVGQSSRDIERILGYIYTAALIRRNDMLILF
ncbi:MAG: glutamate 5-kinase [Myxococcota bacterium]